MLLYPFFSSAATGSEVTLLFPFLTPSSALLLNPITLSSFFLSLLSNQNTNLNCSLLAWSTSSRSMYSCVSKSLAISRLKWSSARVQKNKKGWSRSWNAAFQCPCECFHSWRVLLALIYFALHFFSPRCATVTAGWLASTHSCSLLPYRFHEVRYHLVCTCR